MSKQESMVDEIEKNSIFFIDKKQKRKSSFPTIENLV